MAVVLIIEVDRIISNLCEVILSKEHKILEARNMPLALKLLAEDKPQLVITDLMVPDDHRLALNQSNALKLVNLLRKSNRQVKILVYSVLCYEPEYRKKVISLGADECLFNKGSLELFKLSINNLLGLE